MTFAIKSLDSSIPIMLNTDNWYAKASLTKAVLNIDDIQFEISQAAFQLIYILEKNFTQDDIMVIDVKTKNIEVWRL